MLKRKILTAEIKAVKEKRFKLAKEISVLSVGADLLATKVEKLLNFEFFKQANQNRRITDDKQRKIGRYWRTLEDIELEDIEANLLKK